MAEPVSSSSASEHSAIAVARRAASSPAVFDNGHLVLGERAGLVRADDLRAAQCFHGRQLADDGAALATCRITPMESTIVTTAARPSGIAATASDDGHHEGIEHRLMPQNAHGEDDRADAHNQICERLAQLGKLDLKWCLALFGLVQRVGDLAHLGLHARLRDYGFAASVGDGRAHIDHVAAVAEGNGAAVCLLQGLRRAWSRARIRRSAPLPPPSGVAASITRASAGTASPASSSMTSPGTSASLRNRLTGGRLEAPCWWRRTFPEGKPRPFRPCFPEARSERR